jgi:SecD/SecF fusion protein
VAIGVRGRENFGIDFLGGEEITLSFTHKVPTQDIYSLAEKDHLGTITPVYQKSVGGDQSEFLRIQMAEGKSALMLSALENQFPDAGFKLIGETRIGASVSEKIQWNALISFGMAFLGILLYVAFRFEMGYGVGAVVSILHDVLMSVGIYAMCGNHFSAPMVAAILMIVGYSINDKIVVFDRIREELKRTVGMSLFDVINLSVNKTLSRTTLTSATTFLSALALYVFCSGEIKDLAFLFLLGIVTGTFSSIFIASPILHAWYRGDRRRLDDHANKSVGVYSWSASSGEK